MAIIVATKKDLAEKVAESADLTKNKAAEAVNAVFEAISETLKDGGEVSVSGFGKFEELLVRVLTQLQAKRFRLLQARLLNSSLQKL